MYLSYRTSVRLACCSRVALPEVVADLASEAKSMQLPDTDARARVLPSATPARSESPKPTYA